MKQINQLVKEMLISGATDTKILVNGIDVAIKLTLEVSEDDIHLDDDAFKPASGFFCAHILVKAEAFGLEGFYSLGGCELRPNNLFDSKPFKKSVTQYLKDHGMIENSINHLKSQIETRYAALTEQAKQFKCFSITKES